MTSPGGPDWSRTRPVLRSGGGSGDRSPGHRARCRGNPGGQRRPDQDQRGALDRLRRAPCPAMVASVPRMTLLVRPARAHHHRDRAVRRRSAAISVATHLVEHMDRQMDRQRRAGRGKGRRAVRAPASPRRGRRCGSAPRVCATSGSVSSRPSAAAAAAKDGTPGVTRVGDAERFEPADLLAHRAPHRQIAGVQPRDVVPGRVGGDEFRHDGVEVERRGVDRCAHRAGTARRSRAAPASRR